LLFNYESLKHKESQSMLKGTLREGWQYIFSLIVILYLCNFEMKMNMEENGFIGLHNFSR
jgi:hypothetical protein